MENIDVQFGSADMLEDPFPFYESMRSRCPVFPVLDGKAFVVTRREDLEFITTHPDLFSSRNRSNIPNFPGQRFQNMPDLTSMDGDDHKIIRRAHMTFVSPKRLAAMRPVLENECNAIIDTFIDQNEVEFVEAFAKKFPRWVMGAGILGLPEEIHEQLDMWAVNYFDMFDKNVYHNNAEPSQDQIDSFVTFTNFCGDLAVEHRNNPKDTPLSEFVNFVKPDGQMYTLDEMASYIRLLVVGAQTSANLMAQAVLDTLRLGGKVDVRDSAQAAKVIEESLRFDGAATFAPRICMQDVELGGVKLKAGTRVLLSWLSANRDSETFECPDEFRPDRAKLAKHVGFGLGAHRCIGAPLAQIEGQIALVAMFTRFRRIALSPKNDFKHDTSLTAMRNLRALHLELEAA